MSRPSRQSPARLCLALLALALLSAGPVASLERGDVKGAADKAANWLIRQHNLGEGTFGKGKYSAFPETVAVVVKGLCESPRQYRETLGPFISEPVNYLLKNQRQDGAIAVPHPGATREAQDTAPAVLALKATGNLAHTPTIARAVEYLRSCQLTNAHAEGGFARRHNLTEGDLDTTWRVLKALEAAGIARDSAVFKRTVPFLWRCQDWPDTNPDLRGVTTKATGGGCRRPLERELALKSPLAPPMAPHPDGDLTAALVDSYLICGLPADAPEVQAALGWLLRNYTVTENPGQEKRGYFRYAWALAEAMTRAGIKELALPDGRRARWADELAAQLILLQAKDGSFVNDTAAHMEDDPVPCTACALLALNLCYEAMKK